MKDLLTKGLKGKLTGISLMVFLADLLTKTPELIRAFNTAAEQDVSYVGVAAAAGMLWGVARRFLNEYKFGSV